MPDYQKAKIYKLWSPSKNLVYYGSTTQTLSQRLAQHIKRKRLNVGGQYTSYLVLDCEDYKIELVEEYPCNNRQQLDKKEGEYIKNNECVNTMIAGRTPQEYYEDNIEYQHQKNKNYHENNKEKIAERMRIWREANKEEIAERSRLWREANKEKRNEYSKKWRENNPEKVKEYNSKKYREKIKQELNKNNNVDV